MSDLYTIAKEVLNDGTYKAQRSIAWIVARELGYQLTDDGELIGQINNVVARFKGPKDALRQLIPML